MRNENKALILFILSIILVFFAGMKYQESRQEPIDYSRVIPEYFYSSPITDFMNFTMTSEVLSNLKDYWNKTGEYEYSACLKGIQKTDLNNDTIYKKIEVNIFSINSFSQSSYKTYINVTDCSYSDIAQIHKHPNGNCFHSDADILAFKNQHFRTGVLYDIIQCKENKFMIYNWEEPGRGMLYEI